MAYLYDTIVCGGGPAGWIAAVSSARSGCRTALIERYSFLGGTASGGYVIPLSGCIHQSTTRVAGGITWEFIQRMEEKGAAKVEYPRGHVSFDPEYYKLIAQRMALEAGVALYTNCVITGCKVENGTMQSVDIYSKSGFETLTGNTFIDCTGDADVCHMAGVPMQEDGSEVQPMSLCFLLDDVDLTTDLLRPYIHHNGVDAKRSANPIIHAYLAACREKDPAVPQFGGPWFNTVMHGDQVAVNLTRAPGNAVHREELTRAELKMREDVYTLVELLRKGFKEFEHCAIISTAFNAGVRETRRIKGLKTLTWEEVLSGGAKDAVAFCAHPMDIHKNDDNQQKFAELPVPGGIPYGVMAIPGFENLLCAGRSVSCDRSVLASLRVQATVMCLGEAAGVAAGMRKETGCAMCDVDTAELRARLKARGGIVEV